MNYVLLFYLSRRDRIRVEEMVDTFLHAILDELFCRRLLHVRQQRHQHRGTHEGRPGRNRKDMNVFLSEDLKFVANYFPFKIIKGIQKLNHDS